MFENKMIFKFHAWLRMAVTPRHVMVLHSKASVVIDVVDNDSEYQ